MGIQLPSSGRKTTSVLVIEIGYPELHYKGCAGGRSTLQAGSLVKAGGFSLKCSLHEWPQFRNGWLLGSFFLLFVFF